VNGTPIVVPNVQGLVFSTVQPTLFFTRGVTQGTTLIGGALGKVTLAADTQPPLVSLTTTPSTPGAGHAGFFNAADLAANGGAVTVNVSATDLPAPSSGVTSLACTDNGAPVTVLNQTGSEPRTGQVRVTGDGTHVVTCVATDGAGNTGARTGSTNQLTIRIDTGPPTAVVAYDPSTKSLQVTVRDSGSGVPSGAIAPVVQGAARTYTVTDGAGNRLVLALRLSTESGELTAVVTGLQVCGGTCTSVAVPGNSLKAEWTPAETEEKIALGSQIVSAEFTVASNRTELHTAQGQVDRPGLVLPRLIAAASGLSIEVP
jgi:hypothetical protein